MTLHEYDETVVKQLGRIWGANRVIRNLEYLSFMADLAPSDLKTFRRTAEALISEIETYSSINKKEIARMRNVAPSDIRDRVSAIKSTLINNHKSAFRALSKVEASVIKAQSWLEAECRFDPLPWEGVIWGKFQHTDGMNRLRVYRDDRSELPYIKHPRTAYQARNVSHYELAIGLCTGAPDSYVLDFERRFKEDLNHIILTWEDYFSGNLSNFFENPEFVSPQPVDVCFSIWLWLEIPRFRTKFRPEIQRLLPLIFRFMLPDGALWIPKPHIRSEGSAGKGGRPDFTPASSTLATALLSNALFAFNDEEWIEQHAFRACDLIASQQDSNGSWSIDSASSKDNYTVLLTYLCIEALQRSGQSRFNENISRGRNRLLEIQTDSGAWDCEDVDASFLTRKIIDHFHEISSKWANDTSNKLRRSGKEFIEISHQLLEQGGESNLKMSIIALTHGLEFILYSFLSSPEFSISIFRRDGQSTIGVREALVALKDSLIKKGEISEGSTLRFQSQISLMISTRDSVIHKNATVSKRDVIHWIKEVNEFCSLYLRG